MTEHHQRRVHATPVLLDIGGTVGALMIYTPPERVGQEIEVSPVATPDAKRTHTDVDERQLNGRTFFVAVFAGLEAGDYTIWDAAPGQPTTVRIAGGAVTTLDWR